MVFSEEHQEYIRATRILDSGAPSLAGLRQQLLGFETAPREQVKKLYRYVSSFPLGYNSNDTTPASHVVADGYGQCNTKVNLLAALARGAGVPVRFHAYRIHKHAQRGRMPEWLWRFAPNTTAFTWPEFYVAGMWRPLQELVHVEERDWHGCPFDGAAWQRQPLRQEWIARDDGVWPSPDAYYRKHKPTVHGWRSIGWHLLGRRVMNRHVRR